MAVRIDRNLRLARHAHPDRSRVTLRQRRTVDALLGRVSSAFNVWTYPPRRLSAHLRLDRQLSWRPRRARGGWSLWLPRCTRLRLGVECQLKRGSEVVHVTITKNTSKGLVSYAKECARCRSTRANAAGRLGDHLLAKAGVGVGFQDHERSPRRCSPHVG
jgi:hypothetical protein